MKKNGNSRKTPRAKWIDYDAGVFFITICTYGRVHYFGEIENGKMKLSPIGEIVTNELSYPSLHHSEIEIPLFVVMPNHLHAIIDVKCDNPVKDQPAEQRNLIPSLRANYNMERDVPTLSKYIASFKSAVSREAHLICREFRWQSRYHDHFIRNERELNMISEYILNNEARWDKDCFY